MKYLRIISSITAVFSSLNPLASNAYDVNSKYRPQFHFTPKRNWINDPNGLVYYKGEYHLFFQYNPEGTSWGHMSWGHAVSTDLFHWNELPVAIPEDENSFIFSGSAVIDENNTAGFGKDAMVAIYTSASKENPGIQSQSIAFSTDKGRTFTKYTGNPVLDLGMKNFRDPKVFWDEERSRWVMVIAKSTEHKVSIFTSYNLKNWKFESDFGLDGNVNGIWECPDLFPLTLNGETVWVLTLSFNPGGLYGGSGSQYVMGDFDGSFFKPRNNNKEFNWLDYGQDNYASVTFNNLLDGRRIMIGWMSNWQYANKLKTTAWTGAMTVPHELNLIKKGDQFKLIHKPVSEINTLRSKKLLSITKQKVSKNLKLKKLSGNQLDISFTITPGITSKAGIRVLESSDEFTEIGYDTKSKSLYIDRSSTSKSETNADLGGIQSYPTSLKNGSITLRILVDRSSVEVFTLDGLGVITDLAMPDNNASTSSSLFAVGGQALFTDFVAYELKSALSQLKYPA